MSQTPLKQPYLVKCIPKKEAVQYFTLSTCGRLGQTQGGRLISDGVSEVSLPTVYCFPKLCISMHTHSLGYEKKPLIYYFLRSRDLENTGEVTLFCCISPFSSCSLLVKQVQQIFQISGLVVFCMTFRGFFFFLCGRISSSGHRAETLNRQRSPFA